MWWQKKNGACNVLMFEMRIGDREIERVYSRTRGFQRLKKKRSDSWIDQRKSKRKIGLRYLTVFFFWFLISFHISSFHASPLKKKRRNNSASSNGLRGRTAWQVTITSWQVGEHAQKISDICGEENNSMPSWKIPGWKRQGTWEGTGRVDHSFLIQTTTLGFLVSPRREK